MRTFWTKAAIVAVLALLAAAVSPAYYHFVHFPSFSAPFEPVYEKFDLTQLVDNTLRYYITSAGPEQLAPGDSEAALLSQIRLAAGVWDGVETSGLRIAFGGITEPDTPQTTPGIDILFEEVPPGLIAMGGPTARSEVVSRDGETFVPITRAVVILNRDLSTQPSSSDGFFMTLVHEMGHALGLQHTFTSSVMSTSITRATTKAKPLGADDRAGLSILYPAAGFAETTGSIRGRVVLEDAGVNLASVVALSPQGPAISALSNPDGTYEISGVPSGQYYVYVHPLPPPVYGEVSRANIYMPRGSDGEPLIATDYFASEFFPGVRTVDAASTVTVRKGESAEGVDFFVDRREAASLHSVTTYTFPGNVQVRSAHLSVDAARRFLVAYGIGMSQNNRPTPGLSATVVGGSAAIHDDGLLPYVPDPRFVQMNVDFNPFSGIGPRHLVFSLPQDIYVLPSGFQITQAAPPTIEDIGTTVDSAGEEVVVVAGARISRSSKILFDGIPGEIVDDLGQGRLLVRPPTAPPGHRATVVALNSDGQTSWFLDGLIEGLAGQEPPPSYQYSESEAGSFSMQPSALPVGVEGMIEIRGVNTQFRAGQTLVALGSSDAVIRDFLVLDPELILANVSVSPAASPTVIPATAVTGLAATTQRRVFRVEDADPQRPSMHGPLRDAVSGKPVGYVGRAARLAVTSLPAEVSAAEITLTLNDVPAAISEINEDSIFFAVPAALNAGPAVARLSAAGREATPLLVRLAVAPPVVLGVIADTEPFAVVGEEPVIRFGDRVRVQVSGLGAPGEEVTAEQVSVVVSGFRHEAADVQLLDAEQGVYSVSFFLGTNVAAGAQSLSVVVAGRESAPISVNVAPVQ